MKIVYGRKGQPVGSVDGDDVYRSDGNQIGFLDEEHMYAADDGEWIGSAVAGVVFNAFGDPEGFMIPCESTIPPLPPKIRSMLPPRLKSKGQDVRSEPHRPVPEFLAHMSEIPVRPPWAGFLL